MPYKISGTKSDTARIMVLKESDWSIESNAVVSGSGAYEVDSLVVGAKTVVAESNESEVLAFGNVTPIEYGGSTPKSLWSLGYNGSGQLGLGDTQKHSSPVQVGSATDWEKVDSGSGCTIGIRGGMLWSWGGNSNGQLGLGDITNYSTPQQVGLLDDWSDISCAINFTLAVKTDGTLWAWGRNDKGQLGLGDSGYPETSRSSPVQVGGLSDWSQVGVNHDHSTAIKTDGTLWAWGSNNQGQLGQGDVIEQSSPVQVGGLSDWSQVGGGQNFVLALKTNSTIWSWGNNTSGRLGDGTSIHRSSPVQIGVATNWSNIGATYDSRMAVNTAGELWSWGANYLGLLGLGDVTDRTSPVQVGGTDWSSVSMDIGYATSYIIKTDGSIWGSGSNEEGELGQGNRDIWYYSSPVQVGSDTDWSQVASSTAWSGHFLKTV